MAEMIKSGVAMLEVLEDWGVDHIYGIPGGSFNSVMDALHQKRDSMRYIQVRHEETGALAASAEARLTGRVGVCFGTAGPGATHLFNGLYDAQMDHVPVLALVGQVASTAMNYDAFQELNENPMFVDVSVYNRTVMNPQSLPHVVDEAVRRALEYRGVAVVTIPVDYGYMDIPKVKTSTAGTRRSSVMQPDPKDIAEAVKLIERAERPVLYVGQGAAGAREEILALSERFAMPIVLSVLAKGIVPDSAANFMGMAARVSAKPANEALAACDLILFVGSNFPFARSFFPPQAKFIQVDISQASLGRRHSVDVAVMGDARESMRQMAGLGSPKGETKFLKANRANRKNWQDWLRGFEESDDVPLRVEPVFREINRIAKDDAIFVCDVGNTTINAVRLLNMNGREQRFITSGWFATMGFGVPGGIGAKLSFPERQVFTLSGDGAFAMVMQDIATQVKYKLPVINVVFSNNSLGFIEAEQEDTKQSRYGVLLDGIDFAMAAEAMGAKSFSVVRRDQLAPAFDAAAAHSGPTVIDIKIANTRPFPAENMVLDPERHSAEEIDAFVKRYEAHGLTTLKALLQ